MSRLSDIKSYHVVSNTLYRRAGPPAPSKPGYTQVLADEFTGLTLNARWTAYDSSNGNATFGAPTRIQRYSAANATVGTGSAGATLGASLKLRVTETDNGSGTLPTPGAPGTGSAGTRYSYQAGMVDLRTAASFFGPRYGYYEWRAKVPHGQGLWPSFWLTAKNGGATMAEYDIMEYFHSQLPGKNSSTIHGSDNTGTFHANRFTNNGNPANGTGINGGPPSRTFFEAPTYTPAWHVWAAEILPVTDSTGNTLADPALPSSYVRLRVLLDDVVVWRIVDPSALYYTTNGGTADSFWNIFMQGCQVDGNYVGHPEDALAYSHWLNQCLISGSPGSCSITTGGYTVRRAQFNDPASTTEVDYVRVWKYTG